LQCFLPSWSGERLDSRTRAEGLKVSALALSPFDQIVEIDVR
jgi:hypothetical protein